MNSTVKVETIGETVELYLDAHRMKFSSQAGIARKTNRLNRFTTYLAATHHSMRLTELSCDDGQEFLDSLINDRNSSDLSVHNKMRIRGALRSFSRFLAEADLIEEDVFFNLRLEQGRDSDLFVHTSDPRHTRKTVVGFALKLKY